MATVFLSYDHDDAVHAAPVASALEKAGHSVWWDRHIKGGAEYNHEIESAVDKADAVVVLWSERSIRSAWVRDEAAEGRDQCKLVPVKIEAVKPPMGFRQFQTIDLSGSSRATSGNSLRQLLETIDALAGTPGTSSPPMEAVPARRFGRLSRRTSIAMAALVLCAIAALLVWNWRSQPVLPVIAVAPSDSGARSQALSRDLLVKLGTLARVGASKWQLADPQSARSDPDLVFRVADSGSSGQPQASLMLLDGRRDTVLWSREFTQGAEPDLRQQLSLTAGRVLGCALDAREAGGLSPDLFKLFLVGCAEEAEISSNDPDKTAGIMRTILNRQPRFTPAWARLVVASGNAVAVAEVTGSGAGDARETLAQDIRRAREIAPDLPEIKVAEIELLSPYDYAGALQRLAQAKALAPNKADIWLGEPWPLMRVGRMSDAIESAQRAAELDPLSPAATRERIMTLAYGGRIELAQRELQHAERRWAGTDALRDAQWAFHLRFGDPEIARTVRPGADADLYFQARLNPTPENVNAAVADIQAFMSEMESGNQMNSGGAFGAIQVLGEFHRTEEALEWLDHFPSATVARHSYLLFRPAFADIRRDPRFMVVAKRIGLLNYWRNSGKWPDFCSEPQLPYDCKEEATKLAA